MLALLLLGGCSLNRLKSNQTKDESSQQKLPVNSIYDKVCYYSGVELLNFAELYQNNPNLNKDYFKVYEARLRNNPAILQIYRAAFNELRGRPDLNTQEFAMKYYLICTNLKNFYTRNRVKQCFRLTNIQRQSFLAKLHGKSRQQVMQHYIRKSGPISDDDYRGLSGVINMVYESRSPREAYSLMYTTFKLCRDKTEVILSAH